MLGWNMVETNRTVGALLGYSSVKVRDNLNVPPSHGVSSGPNMTALQTIMLLSCGAPFIPEGGSDCSRLKSLIRRFLAGVLILAPFYRVDARGRQLPPLRTPRAVPGPYLSHSWPPRCRSTVWAMPRTLTGPVRR
eukprot:scaffold2539_cov388-Prasinococcus_capsulatus_cf.AAC.15